jgi:HlyD family secretion protein
VTASSAPTAVADARTPPAAPPLIPLPPPLWARGPLRDLLARLRRVTRTSGPGLLVVACALAACTSSSAPPAAQTARVQRTTVSTAVSSSGALSASTEQNLGFAKGGKLTAVDVKVGDRVTAGQVLATVDDAALRRVLEQQQAQLDAQRAVLTRLINSTTVQGALNSVEQAQAILSATEDQARATREADDVTLRRAEKQLDFDEDARDDADDQLKTDQAACAASTGTGSSTTGTFSRTTLPSPAVASAMSALGDPTTDPTTDTSPGTEDGTSTGEWGPDDASSSTTGGSTTGTGTMRSTSTGSTGTTGSTGMTSGGSTTGSGTGTGTTGSTGTTDTGSFSALTAPVDPVGSGACSRVPADQPGLAQAERTVVASRTARDQARQKRDVDEAAGRVSIENARQGLVSAQNNRDSAATDRPSTIAQQQAVVDGAAAGVRQAQQDVDDTVLRAPVDGTVSALNGAVGEYVAPSAATSALAPGSGAAIPGTGGAAAAGTSAVARPGGTQFLVLDGVDTFQVVVPFEESDAARIAPNQNVDVTFDAIPDLVRHGTVLAVAPTATATSNVVSYYVTVVLTETDARLRDGQTAQAAVHTSELHDVPAVPNAAVHREGGQTTVTVVGFDGTQRTVPFQAGVVGDDLTQVVSGLTVGDEVVVPAGR